MQVSTKLNRSHLVHGRQALILPCLGRTEKDHQAGGLQSITVEDSMSMVHLSVGMKAPASPHLLSEPAIIAGMARAALPDTAARRGRSYADDYDRIRDTMARVLDGFEDFNRRVRLAAGVPHPRSRPANWSSSPPPGRAEFSVAPSARRRAQPRARLLLGTMRSHDQWNTTIYSDNDRYRGVKNLRTLIFMNRRRHARRAASASSTWSTSPASPRTAPPLPCAATGRCPTTSRAAARPATCRR